MRTVTPGARQVNFYGYQTPQACPPSRSPKMSRIVRWSRHADVQLLVITGKIGWHQSRVGETRPNSHSQVI